MHRRRVRSERIGVSRFNRRLHQLADWMTWISEVVEEVFTAGDVFIIDRLPVPVCRRVRARRYGTAPRRECCLHEHELAIKVYMRRSQKLDRFDASERSDEQERIAEKEVALSE